MDPVVQEFIADVRRYVEPLKEAADEARKFAEDNQLAVATLKEIRDNTAETGIRLSFLNDDMRQLIDTEERGILATRELTEQVKDLRTALLEQAGAARAARDQTREATTSTGGLAGILRLISQGFKDGKGNAGIFAGTLKGLGGAFQQLWSQGSALQGVLGSAGLAGGIAGLTVAFGALLGAVTSILGPLLAGGLALGALAAVAYPALSQLKQSLSGLSNTTNAYTVASQKLSVAIHASKADWLAYQASIKLADPVLRSAVLLLNNQNVQWQDLSPSMQRAVIALSQNKEALKGLLPAQKQALEALIKEKDAWDALTPAQQEEARLLHGIGAAWSKITTDLQPQISQLITTILKLVKDTLPFIEPLAKAAFRGLEPLLQALDKFVLSPGFKEFMDRMIAMAPGAIMMFGKALGQAVLAFGQLITVLSQQESLAALEVVLYLIVGALKALVFMIKESVAMWRLQAAIVVHTADVIHTAFDRMRHGIMSNLHDIAHEFDNSRHTVATWGHTVADWFDIARHTVATWAHDVAHWFDEARHTVAAWVDHVIAWFTALPGRIRHAIGNAGTMLVAAGQAIIQGLINGMMSMLGGVINTINGIVNWIKNHLPFSPAKTGPLSGSGDPYYAGRSIVRNLARGMRDGRAELTAAAAGVAAIAGLAGATGGAAAGFGGAARGGGALIINLTVQGSVISEDRLRALFQELQLRWGRRNFTSGFHLAGRLS